MNHLQHETSPYLLQHAHNPVEWYAWRQEAFERARRENKPIIVSIGYSTCHWCHVMEKESFEDQDTADFMNTHFINIKVDREERPDVDQIYMEACQAISGSGGWPLNCFLTPDAKPFFAGTYYPPMPAHNRPSWMQVMAHMLRQFNDNRETVEEQANHLVQMIHRSDNHFIKTGIKMEQPLSHFRVTVETIFQNFKDRFDREAGGFGGAPKFPVPSNLRYLLHFAHFTNNEDALQHLLFSLDKMIEGGIYDQLGGGFARYTVDKNWIVPHFEKMLYDNAQLVGLLAEAYQATRQPHYQDTILETLDFIEREMMHPEGGFFSALDADSEGEEGKFYVWQKAEVDAILGEDAPLFSAFYGVTEAGNWEHTNILTRQRTLADLALKLEISEAVLNSKLETSKAKMLEARSQRVRPGLDDKVILSWNALMNTGYSRAYAATGLERFREVAVRNMEFLLEKFAIPGKAPALFHTFKDGVGSYQAFLDDYAFLIEALLELYGITFEEKYLDAASRLTELVVEEFLDPETKMFYFTSARHSDIPMRRKDLYDSATPSGNSTMLHNLSQLSIILGKKDYELLADQQLRQVLESVERYPGSFGNWALAALYLVFPKKEVGVVGPAFEERASEIRALFLPNKVLMGAATGKEAYPLLAQKGKQGETLIYLCEQYACQQPVQTVAELVQLVQRN